MREPNEIENRFANVVIGAAIEVHRELGPGYDEKIYEESLEYEFQLQNIPYCRQKAFQVNDKSKPVGQRRLDLLVGDCLIVEAKAVEKVLPVRKCQVISYLKANKLVLGLILNFNVTLMKDGIFRIVYSGD